MSDLVYVALGSNLGDREAALNKARAAIAAIRGTRIVAESTIEETEPIGPAPQSRYLNQMIAVETTLAPRHLALGTAANRARSGTCQVNALGSTNARSRHRTHRRKGIVGRSSHGTAPRAAESGFLAA